VSGPNSRGAERFECPADAGQIRCPLKPMSQLLPTTLPAAAPHPGTRSPLCAARTVTIPETVEAKLRQRDYWGSENWLSAAARQSRVEGSFGITKDASKENLRRGTYRVTGLVPTTIVVTICAAAANLRIARGWAETNPAPLTATDPLLTPDPPFDGWDELHP
jgi:hypothetical protein